MKEKTHTAVINWVGKKRREQVRESADKKFWIYGVGHEAIKFRKSDGEPTDMGCKYMCVLYPKSVKIISSNAK